MKNSQWKCRDVGLWRHQILGKRAKKDRGFPGLSAGMAPLPRGLSVACNLAFPFGWDKTNICTGTVRVPQVQKTQVIRSEFVSTEKNNWHLEPLKTRGSNETSKGERGQGWRQIASVRVRYKQLHTLFFFPGKL